MLFSLNLPFLPRGKESPTMKDITRQAVCQDALRSKVDLVMLVCLEGLSQRGKGEIFINLYPCNEITVIFMQDAEPTPHSSADHEPGVECS